MNYRVLFAVLLPLLAFCPALEARLELPALVGDNMVLQRDRPLTLWGWADAGQTVTVSFRGQQHQCRAEANGKWQVQLAAMPAGGPYEMTIAAGEVRTLKNILLGDVWLCSGQSNMAMLLDGIPARYDAAVSHSLNPNLRLFTVGLRYGLSGPLEKANGRWSVASPETVRHFSAVAYFFGQTLQRRYNIPVGLILSACSGSHIEAWISAEDLKPFPQYFAQLNRYADPATVAAINAREHAATEEWHRNVQKGDVDYSHGVPAHEVEAWHATTMPGEWNGSKQRTGSGVFWIRREFELAPTLAGQSAILDLGRIEDEDDTFLNGTRVGHTGNEFQVRYYQVPAGVLKAGRNEIALRIINSGDGGGIVPGFACALRIDEQTIDLSGTWKGKATTHYVAKPSSTAFRNHPAALYNSMIAPLKSYGVKGVIWYQGEGNAMKPREYRDLLPALITDWRRQFRQGDLPFLIVQLPEFRRAEEQPAERGGWANIREAQAMALALPNTGLAVTLGTGAWNNLHPARKQEVGERLALVAAHVAYHEEIPYGGPLYRAAHFDGPRVILDFDLCGSAGLATIGHAPVRGFAIAGADRRFVWADAKIEGNHVVVWSDAVPHPAAVRYAWASNPATANLTSTEGLPAGGFRTDDWPEPAATP